MGIGNGFREEMQMEGEQDFELAESWGDPPRIR